MAVFNVNDTDPNKTGGDFPSVECDAILVVEDYKEVAGNDPHGLFSVTIDSATVPNQAGKKWKDRKFSFTVALNKVFEFACALGIYSKPQWEQDKASGVNPTIMFENSVNMMFATPIRHGKWGEWNETNAKDNINKAKSEGNAENVAKWEKILAAKQGMLQMGGESGFTFWAIGDPEADHIPIKPEVLAMFPGGLLPTKQGVPRKRGTPAGPSMPANRPTAPAAGTQVNRPASAAATQPAAAAPVMGSGFF